MEAKDRYFRIKNFEIDDGIIAKVGVHAWAVYCILRRSGLTCFPSHSRIAKLCGISVKTSQRCIKLLESHSLISVDRRNEKRTKTRNVYRLNGDSQSLSKDNASGEMATHSRLDSDSQSPEIATHSRPKKTNRRRLKKKTKSSCPKTKFSDEDMATAKFIFSKIQQINPDHKPPNFTTWANDIRLMRERDGRPDAEIRDLFAWTNADEFWQSNILSPAKLRKQWDTLTIKRKNEFGSNRHNKRNALRTGGVTRAAHARAEGF